APPMLASLSVFIETEYSSLAVAVPPQAPSLSYDPLLPSDPLESSSDDDGTPPNITLVGLTPIMDPGTRRSNSEGTCRSISEGTCRSVEPPGHVRDPGTRWSIPEGTCRSVEPPGRSPSLVSRAASSPVPTREVKTEERASSLPPNFLAAPPSEPEKLWKRKQVQLQPAVSRTALDSAQQALTPPKVTEASDATAPPTKRRRKEHHTQPPSVAVPPIPTFSLRFDGRQWSIHTAESVESDQMALVPFSSGSNREDNEASEEGSLQSEASDSMSVQFVSSPDSEVQSRTKQTPIPPSEKGRKLDTLGHNFYSFAILQHKIVNYQGAMGAYQRDLLTHLHPFLELIPEEKRAEASALSEELMALAAQQMRASKHSFDAASKVLNSAITLRRHSWLRTTGLSDDHKAQIKFLPFSGSGLFNTTTARLPFGNFGNFVSPIGDYSSYLTLTLPSRRGRFPTSEASHRTSTILPSPSRLLLPLFHGPKEGCRPSTHSGSPIPNKFLVDKKFRMVTFEKIIPLLRRGDWFGVVDLKDAYFHILIHPAHLHLLRFAIGEDIYQFPPCHLVWLQHQEFSPSVWHQWQPTSALLE
ncbi:hypothetical protein JRQ81_019294, partial [Phrynocephalus forsythii]